jgi:hypothetical protein
MPTPSEDLIELILPFYLIYLPLQQSLPDLTQGHSQLCQLQIDLRCSEGPGATVTHWGLKALERQPPKEDEGFKLFL